MKDKVTQVCTGIIIGVIIGMMINPKPASAGGGISESAYRMAMALERIAGAMERR